MDFKQILPLEWNYFLKHWAALIRFKEPSFAADLDFSVKHIYFLDTPAYANLGDQAIAYAMRSFMKDILPEYVQYEISEDKLPLYLKWLKKNIKTQDIICLTGGGNMGVDYQRYEAVRRLVLNNFKNNTVIIFPQTYDYCDTPYGVKERKKAVKLYNSIPKLILSAREETSYKLMKEDFPNAKVILCPDIVLYLNCLNYGEHNKDTGLCLREDKETLLTEQERNYLKERFSPYTLISTTLKSSVYISEKNRTEKVKSVLKQIACCKLFVTDRLHGMIFAFITNTPCLAFPNANKKVKYVFDKWLSGKGNIYYAENTDKIPQIKYNGTNSLLKDYFKDFKETVLHYAKNEC